LIYLEQLAKMSKDQRKLCVINAAKKENAKMIENNNGRSSNYGAKPINQSGGRPRLSDINRSQIAQSLLELANKGMTVQDAARTTGISVGQINRKARRYQITFKENNSETRTHADNAERSSGHAA
jgi:transcriptional regulator with GAF, ATPase, and Fis domain